MLIDLKPDQSSNTNNRFHNKRQQAAFQPFSNNKSVSKNYCTSVKTEFQGCFSLDLFDAVII